MLGQVSAWQLTGLAEQQRSIAKIRKLNAVLKDSTLIESNWIWFWHIATMSVYRCHWDPSRNIRGSSDRIHQELCQLRFIRSFILSKCTYMRCHVLPCAAMRCLPLPGGLQSPRLLLPHVLWGAKNMIQFQDVPRTYGEKRKQRKALGIGTYSSLIESYRVLSSLIELIVERCEMWDAKHCEAAKVERRSLRIQRRHYSQLWRGLHSLQGQPKGKNSAQQPEQSDQINRQFTSLALNQSSILLCSLYVLCVFFVCSLRVLCMFFACSMFFYVRVLSKTARWSCDSRRGCYTAIPGLEVGSTKCSFTKDQASSSIHRLTTSLWWSSQASQGQICKVFGHILLQHFIF